MAATAQIPPYKHGPGRYAQIFAAIGLVLFACFGVGARERGKWCPIENKSGREGTPLFCCAKPRLARIVDARARAKNAGAFS